MRKVNIGLTEEQRQGSCELLNRNLSDSYLLQIKTKKYHWDVTGPEFRSIHQLLQEQYEMLDENIDSTAERVRALGGFPVGTAEGFLQYGSIKEHSGEIPDAYQMISNLADDHEQVIRNLREYIDRAAEEFHDQGTSDFFTDLIKTHEEMAWMLRSFIEGRAIQPDNQLPQGQVKFPAGTVS
jgi:starvation-inducible DNA-binding protein